MLDYQFHWRAVLNDLPELLGGAAVTLQVTALSVLIGVPLAVLLAACLRGSPAARRPARALIEVTRNTPCLFQLYLFYYGLGALGVNLPSFAVAVVAIGLNNAGFLADTYCSALQAVPMQQAAAARSLGMSFLQASRHVVLPQMARIAYLPTINQVVWAMLNSSLGTLIGLRELTGVTQFVQSRSFRTLEFFLLTAALYYVLAKLLMLAAALLGRRLMRGTA